MKYKIKLANIDQVDEIINIYKERINWFKDNNINQWSEYIINHPKEEFLKSIENNTFYTILDDNKIIGGFEIVNYNSNWNDLNTSAYYIGKLVIKTNYKNIGKVVMSFCKEKAIKDNKKYLRLDCVKRNIKLNNIYEKHGFKLIKYGENERYSYALREMEI